MPFDPGQQLHIAVCDDEPLDRRRISELAGKIMGGEGLAFRISAYENGTDLLSAIQGGVRFHILLLDVVMDAPDGMELAAKLRELGDDTAIVFISSNREMALRGYEVAAVRYLAKPVEEDKLREALVYCCRNCRQKKEILLPTAKGRSRISLLDIIYAETWDRGVRLTLPEGRVETSLKISELTAMLPEGQFVFCHRTVLVNLAFVHHLRCRELELKSGEVLPVSKYRLPVLRKQLLDYLGS